MLVYFGTSQSPVIRVWSAHSAVCLLPLVDQPISVLVSVGLPQCVLPTGSQVFTYYREPEEQRFAAALRLLNYHITKCIEEPDVIASRIFGERQL